MGQILLPIEVGGEPDASAEELDRLAIGLREELLQLDVFDVERMTTGPPPPGAKGLGDGTGPALAVMLSNSAVVVALVGVLRSWVTRGRGRTITIRLGEDEIVVTEASEQDVTALIESWIKQHGPRRP